MQIRESARSAHQLQVKAHRLWLEGTNLLKDAARLGDPDHWDKKARAKIEEASIELSKAYKKLELLSRITDAPLVSPFQLRSQIFCSDPTFLHLGQQ